MLAELSRLFKVDSDPGKGVDDVLVSHVILYLMSLRCCDIPTPHIKNRLMDVSTTGVSNGY